MSKKLIIMISVLAVALVLVIAGVGFSFVNADSSNTSSANTAITCPGGCSNAVNCNTANCPMMPSGANAGAVGGCGNCPMRSAQ